MKNLEIYENFQQSNRVFFNDSQISNYQKMWDWLPEKYRNNSFFLNVWQQMRSKKSLTKKQWTELEYLLKNGKSRYEAGILPPNY